MCLLTCSISRALLYPLLPAMLSPRLLCLSCIVSCCEELCWALAWAMLWWLLCYTVVSNQNSHMKETGLCHTPGLWASAEQCKHHDLICKKWREYGNWKQYAAVTNKYICFLKTMYFKMNRCQNRCVRSCVLFDFFETNVLVYFIY